jgi:hypothetical protein
MIVFCWGMRVSFWSRPPGRDFKHIRMRQQNNHLSHEIQTLFFYNRILKFWNFLIFVKFSLDAKIFVKNDILCDLITMHKCHVFLTVVEKCIFYSVEMSLIAVYLVFICFDMKNKKCLKRSTYFTSITLLIYNLISH